MRIDAERRDRTFHYRLALDADDRRRSHRDFWHGPTAPLELVSDSWQVELPFAPRALHPDLHAAAILTAVQVFVGSRLALPFGVSAAFAAHARDAFGLELPNVDAGLAPRRPPVPARACLLFSGGMDSMAASLVFPARTLHLFLDRIVHPEAADPDNETVVDLVFQRALCDALRADGREVHASRDDHEALYRPYPAWASDPSRIPALYLADHCGLHHLDMGDVLGSVFLTGYRPQGGASSWRFRPAADGDLPPRERANAALLGAVGLARRASLCGLSEVATTALVRRSAYWGRTTSCYLRSDRPFCLRCDKCFKKIVLGHVVMGEEVPSALVDHFLQYRHLAEIFTGGYFDWHHIWYYIFQHARCRHPLFVELGRQARQGPDLSYLARWYPGTRERMVPDYRAELEARVTEQVGVMTPDEVARLESMDLPPLDAPDLRTFWPGAALEAERAAAAEAEERRWGALGAALTAAGGGAAAVALTPQPAAGEAPRALRARFVLSDGHLEVEARPAEGAGAALTLRDGRTGGGAWPEAVALLARLAALRGIEPGAPALPPGGPPAAAPDVELAWFGATAVVRDGDGRVRPFAALRPVGDAPGDGFPCGAAWRFEPAGPLAGADVALATAVAEAAAAALAPPRAVAAADADAAEPGFLAALWETFGRATLPRAGAHVSLVGGRVSRRRLELDARSAAGEALTLVFEPAAGGDGAPFASNGRVDLHYRAEEGRPPGPALRQLVAFFAAVLRGG